METTLNRTEFINQYPPFALLNTANTASVLEKRAAHLYVHLPFCRHRCSYCFFKVYVRNDREFIDNYVAALKREIDLQSASPHARSRVFKSLYFGGGTPTVLDCDHLEEIIRYVQDKFEFTPDYELCVEAKPDKLLTDEKLKLLKDIGTRRISFGVESFNDDIIRLNGRANKNAIFLEKYEAARKHGFDIVSVDLMSGLYGETPENWNSTVNRLLELRPDNVAFYKLEVYYNTGLFKLVRQESEKLPPLMTNDQEIALIRTAYDRLQDEGNYMLANCFTLMSSPDKEHVHRKGIWQGEEMLGLGLSAHSYFNNHFYQNTPAMDEYCRVLDTGHLPIQRAYRCTVEDEISMVMVYGVKSLCIDRSMFKQKFGVDITDIYGDKITEMLRRGYMSLDDKVLSVNREYYIHADDIAREFFLPRYRNMMLAHHLRK